MFLAATADPNGFVVALDWTSIVLALIAAGGGAFTVWAAMRSTESRTERATAAAETDLAKVTDNQAQWLVEELQRQAALARENEAQCRRDLDALRREFESYQAETDRRWGRYETRIGELIGVIELLREDPYALGADDVYPDPDGG